MVYTTISWNLPLLEAEAVITVSDISSRIIAQHTIKTKQGQWIWDTRNIRKGIYLFEVKTSKESLAHGKIVVSE